MLYALRSLRLENKSFSQIAQIKTQMSADDTLLTAVFCCYPLLNVATDSETRIVESLIS